MSESVHAAAATKGDETEHLQCMDIWGGTEAVDRVFSVTGLDVHIVSAPYRGEKHGGDIYYVSMCGSGRIARLALADVSGHGERVAQTSGQLRKLMRRYINTPNPEHFARALNEAFLTDSEGGTFATALLATYWAPTDHLILVNAGHPPPLLYRAGENRWSLLTSDLTEVRSTRGADVGIRNLPLGILDPIGYDQIAVRLGRGDMVVLYTDALPEAKNAAGRLLGLEGLRSMCDEVETRAPKDLASALLAAVAEFRGGQAPDDDQTVLVLHHNGEDPPPMGVGGVVHMLGRMIGVLGPSEAAQH